jgi:aryl-alcohol dehydrogenase-like predicted oxidoreductase
MKLTTLGKSPLKVSRLCLGTMMFGDQTPLEDARTMVADAQERGCNFIDTADIYTLGKSEVMVGQVLKGQRHRWVLASKVGNPMSDQPNHQGYSRSWMMRACEDSLSRLDTDHLDIYYLHRDYNGMNLEEPLRAIEALLRDGKIRYWGVSNFRGWRIAEMVSMARQMNMPGPVVCQPYYNLLNRLPEVEILEACGHYGLGVVPYSPIARGRAHGQICALARPPQRAAVPPGVTSAFWKPSFVKSRLQIAQTLRQHCERKGVSLAHFATAWVLANRYVSAVIAGPRTLAQWQDYAGALDVRSPPKTKPWSTAWWPLATHRRPVTTIRLIP